MHVGIRDFPSIFASGICVILLNIHNQQSGKFPLFRQRKRQTNHFRNVFIRVDFCTTLNNFRGYVGVTPYEGLFGHNNFSRPKIKFDTKPLFVKLYKKLGQTYLSLESYSKLISVNGSVVLLTSLVNLFKLSEMMFNNLAP